MFTFKFTPKREYIPLKPNPERLRILNQAERNFPGMRTSMMEMKFDPAFLRFVEWPHANGYTLAVAVYNRDVATEILMSEVAGWKEEGAWEEILILCKTFEAGEEPWFE